MTETHINPSGVSAPRPGRCAAFGVGCACLLMAIVGSVLPCAAAVHYVNPAGDDSASGDTPAHAWQSIPHAFGSLSAGDVLVVGGGVYFLQDTAGYSFEGLDRCWIVGAPRGKAVLSYAWRNARLGSVSWEHVGDGIYRTPDPGMLHTTAVWNGSFLQRLPLEAIQNGVLTFDRKGKTYTYSFPRYGFAVESDGYLYVRLPQAEDPNGESIVFQRTLSETTYERGLLRVEQSPGVIIDGLVFEGIHNYALVTTAGKNDRMHIRNCEFRMCRGGLSVRWSDSVVVEWNEYHFPGYDDYIHTVREMNTTSEKDGDVPFVMGKTFFVNEAGLVVASKVIDYQCRYNYAHDSFDGFGFGGSRRAHFHHNVMWGLGDNGIETDYIPSPFGEDMHIHHNLFINCKKGAVSQQYIGHLSDSIPGPFYVYRNVIIGYRPSGWYPWTVLKGVSNPWAGGYRLFNNTIWVKGACLFSLATSQTTDAAQRTVWWQNNILLFTKNMADCYGYGTALPDSQIGANILVSETNRPFITADGGMYLQTMDDVAFSDPALGMDDDGDIDNDFFDFGLTSASPARDAGTALPGGYPRLDTVGRIDIGAVEYGRTTDEYGVAYDSDWPRPRRTVHDTTTPEGFSPLPDPTAVAQSMVQEGECTWDAFGLCTGPWPVTAADAAVDIRVFDVQGRTVKGEMRPWSGVRLVRMVHGGRAVVRRLTIVR